MTFEQGLIASNYYYQPECGAWVKEDSEGFLHSYLQLEESEWSYEKYDSSDNLVTSKTFTL